jgi:hypothetical protein
MIGMGDLRADSNRGPIARAAAAPFGVAASSCVPWPTGTVRAELRIFPADTHAGTMRV